MKLITIPQAAKLLGVSETTIKRNIRAGRFPVIRANSQHGKILLDAELLELVLRQEAYNSIRGCSMDEDTQEPAAEPTSHLASLFKPQGDEQDQEAARDIRFGYTPMNTNKYGSFQG